MKNKYLLLIVAALFISVPFMGCDKDDDDEDESNVESYIGSYDFTVTVTIGEYILNGCDTIVTTGTHVITINDNDTLPSNQLVVRNLIKNNNTEVIIDITDDTFIITDPDDYSGSGTKSGSSIEIEYVYEGFGCFEQFGTGTATKR